MAEMNTDFSGVVLTDTLIHDKMSNGEEVIMFPYTRYDNVLGSPKIVTDLESFHGAPFFFLSTYTVEVDDETLTTILGMTI